MALQKVIKNMVVTAQIKGGKADIRIVDYIGEWGDTSSRTVRAIVDEMITAGVTEARVYINSRGGDIFEAVEIANELARFSKVTIIIGSIAASAATYIISKFKKDSTAKKNSQFMIHRPSAVLSGDIVSLTARLKLLENTTNDYKETYATATGKTVDEIEALWTNGDYWMTADEAYKLGFIGAVADDEQVVTADDVTILEACGAPNIPEIKNSNNKTNSTTMERTVIIASLGLAADATDAQIEAALKDAKSKADQLTANEANEKDGKVKRATTLVTNAIADRKITADLGPDYITMATDNYDTVSAMFDKMKGVPKPDITPGTPGATADTVRANWSLQDYLDKAPHALAQLAKDDKAHFDKLNAEHYG